MWKPLHCVLWAPYWVKVAIQPLGAVCPQRCVPRGTAAIHGLPLPVPLQRTSSCLTNSTHSTPTPRNWEAIQLFAMSSGSVSSLTNPEMNGHSGEEPANSTPLRTQTSPAATLYPDPSRVPNALLQIQPPVSPAVLRANKFKAGELCEGAVLCHYAHDM